MHHNCPSCPLNSFSSLPSFMKMQRIWIHCSIKVTQNEKIHMFFFKYYLHILQCSPNHIQLCCSWATVSITQFFDSTSYLLSAERKPETEEPIWSLSTLYPLNRMQTTPQGRSQPPFSAVQQKNIYECCCIYFNTPKTPTFHVLSYTKDWFKTEAINILASVIGRGSIYKGRQD